MEGLAGRVVEQVLKDPCPGSDELIGWTQKRGPAPGAAGGGQTRGRSEPQGKRSGLQSELPRRFQKGEG